MIAPMFDPRFDLLCTRLAALVDGAADDWTDVREALDTADEAEGDLAALVELRDVDGLRALLDGWRSGETLFTVHDRGVLKRAVKAFRKRLKLARLDEESRIGGAMSAGERSGLVGVEPPDTYPPDVWAELVRQGRLLESGHRQLELPPDA
jgi:hypothetical protein